ncbi:MAG TPA: c-type cytochrome domain-containing protein [Flavipsychrobacter sp.]
MKKAKVLVLILAGTLTIAACKHKGDTPVPVTNNTGGNNNGGNNGGNNNGGNNVDTGICFTRDILPIFVSNCAVPGCHDALTKSEGFQFTDYNSIVSKEFVPGNADATELYEKITEDKADKIMPPPPNSPLTSAQITLIRRWINEGAKNTTNCGSPCDTTKFTYAAEIQPIFDKYCKGCHSGAAAQKGIMLDTYSGASAVVGTGRLLGAIRHEAGFVAMPYGSNKMSDCEITKIEKWVAAGAQNN